MKLSIITVNTNDGEKILDQIESVIHGAGDLAYEQFVSDNGSTDNSVQDIEKKYKHIKIIKNKKNIGFGAANNAVLSDAKGDYFLFLNPDMRVEKDSLPKIIAWMDKHVDVGIASIKLLDKDGNVSQNALPRRFPHVFDQIMILTKVAKIFPQVLKKYLYVGFDVEKEQEVDSVRGSFMVVRRELVDKLGWAFDPRYFIWFEDVDICREAQKYGYKVMYTPIISCIDYVGQTFKRLPTLQKQKWFTSSMVKYFKKWEPWYKWMLIVLMRPIAIVLTKVYDMVTH
jgi:N-acetylglucosaminyl-diphospho-decaprenol L-rhamnosyltransferase